MKKRWSAVLLAALSFGTPGFAADSRDNCAGARDLRLVNGKIVTMDKRNTVLSEVTAIQNGLVNSSPKLSPCTKVINLRGRTVWFRGSSTTTTTHRCFCPKMRPGHDIRLETANSIADAQAMIQARVKTVPAGAFITALGDWNIKQFAEKRLPTLAELDAAAPANPVLINGGGGTVTNSRGKSFFEGKGVTVAASRSDRESGIS